MSAPNAQSLARGPVTTAKAPSHGASGVLQRQCSACGNHTSGAPTCSSCNGEKKLLQRKLTIGSEGDALEREADRVADQVTRGAARGGVQHAPPQIQRVPATAGATADAAPASVHQVLQGTGAPLETRTRRDMEGRFGRDFSAVRVHTGDAAARSTRDVNARAYTVGRDIVFGTGEFAPRSGTGRRLLAHELTHVLQQSADAEVGVVRRATTRGAGGCGPAADVDEDNDGAKAAGKTAHVQIQAYVAPKVMSEITIPRGTKKQRDKGCQPDTTHNGFADLMSRAGTSVQVGEIKPFPWASSYGVEEAEHYILRAEQSAGRQFGKGACGADKANKDDNDFAKTVGSKFASFSKMTGVLPSETVIGAFDGDKSRTLKAKQTAPGAVGYWCTGGKSDTFTCGASDKEIQDYIDKVLVPAQSLVDDVLDKQIEEPLKKKLENLSAGELLVLGMKKFGPKIKAILAESVGDIIAGQILDQINPADLGKVLDQAIGPEVKSFIRVIARRFVSLIMNELRTMLRKALADMIREALTALCVGAPVVTLVQLLEKLKEMIRQRALQLIPVAAAAAAAAFVAEVLAAIGEALKEVGNVLLKILAFIALVVLAVAIVVVGIIFVLSVIDPVPGDEVAVGAAELFLINLLRSLGGFVFAAASTGGGPVYAMGEAGGEQPGTGSEEPGTGAAGALA